MVDSFPYKVEIVSERLINNLTLLENTYSRKFSKQIVTSWSLVDLQKKYNNKIYNLSGTLADNHAIILTATDSNQDVVGIIVLKKMFNLQRLIISDILTIEDDKKNIVISLIRKSLMICSIKKLNSIMFLGFPEDYKTIIASTFKSLNRKKEHRIYAFSSDRNINLEDISLFYKDDDINY